MKKTLKNFTALLLVMLFAVLLCACDGGGGEDAKPLEDYKGEWVDLFVDGVTEYQIVRPELMSDTDNLVSIKLYEHFNDTIGMKMKITTDWVKRGEEVPADTKELLVGNTNRSESINAEDLLRYDDFIVSVTPNRVVLLGGNIEATEAAVDCFIENFVRVTETENGKSVQIPLEYTYMFTQDYPVKSIVVDGVDIGDCKIISSDASAIAANQLRDRIISISGEMPEIIRDTKADGSESGFVLKVDDTVGAPGEYKITHENTMTTITGASPYGLLNAIKAINAQVLTDAKEGITITADAYSAMEPLGKVENSITLANGSIMIENQRALIIIDQSGITTSFIEKSTGRNINANSASTPFCYLAATKGANRNPQSLSLDGNVITAKFDSCELSFKTEVYDDFVSFELIGEVPAENYSLSFANFKLDYDYENDKSATGFGYSMNINTHHVYYPSGESKAIRGDCFTELGTAGAKLAVIACPKEDQRQIMQTINTYIPEGMVALTASGGANALDNAENFGDYVIISDSDPAKVPDWIEFYTKYSVDQLDFHQGGSTFRQGDFKFHKTGTAAAFKEQVSDPLAEAGILCSLHTYSFYIDYNASGILADPYWQQQLDVLYTYTLASDISKTDKNIKTNESTEDVPREFGYNVVGSPFILIDEELIRIVPDENGFTNCQRGMGGTKIAEHKAGAEIRYIGGYYSMIAPTIGSELFYEIARRSAQAYNEGGFRMFYLDAFDGIYRHCTFHGTSDYLWYYTASYVNEIIKHCDTSPMFEYSMITPAIWTARGRAGAWDHPTRSFKQWNDLHLNDNLKLVDRHYTTTMGWYNFFPTNNPANYLYNYHFIDDVDYLGVIGIAYNQSIVYNGLTEAGLSTYPGLKRNMDRYIEYSVLRKSNYFSNEVIEILREGAHEYSLAQVGDKWGFYEVDYNRAKLRELSKNNTLQGVNNFKEQSPYIRIENLLSTLGEAPIMLMDLDAEKEINAQPLLAEYERLDITNNLALKVRIHGNNSEDHVLIRLEGHSTTESGLAEYVIPLNFEGWKEIYLTDTDNGEYDHIKFTGKSHGSYEIYRANISFNRIETVEVYKSGHCNGVKIDYIEAVRHLPQQLINPTITVGDSTVRFLGSIEATEYLEYFPGDEKATVYDGKGTPREIEVDGELIVPAGEFEAVLDGTPSGKGDAYATLVIGCYGDFITNK